MRPEARPEKESSNQWRTVRIGLTAPLILFGFIFWIILGIDTKFQPFTTLINMARDGVTPEGEARVRFTTNVTMAWALLLYLNIAAIAFLGTVKPFY